MGIRLSATVYAGCILGLTVMGNYWIIRFFPEPFWTISLLKYFFIVMFSASFGWLASSFLKGVGLKDIKLAPIIIIGTSILLMPFSPEVFPPLFKVLGILISLLSVPTAILGWLIAGIILIIGGSVITGMHKHLLSLLLGTGFVILLILGFGIYFISNIFDPLYLKSVVSFSISYWIKYFLV
ncbi:MAG: hypothetical protein ACOC80_14110 [Petrotogales bacterium]